MTLIEAVKQELLAHYVELCGLSKEWKRQAWISANDLAGQFPAEFSDLPEMLTEAMKEKNGEQNRLAHAGTDAGRLPRVVPVVREQA